MVGVHAIGKSQVQLRLPLSDDQAALWHVALSASEGRRSFPLAWEGYAPSSTSASAAAIDWAKERLCEADPMPKLRVLEVLQVGT